MNYTCTAQKLNFQESGSVRLSICKVALGSHLQCGKLVLYALPPRLLVDNTQARILMDCGGGYPVSAPEVGGNMTLVAVDFGRYAQISEV